MREELRRQLAWVDARPRLFATAVVAAALFGALAGSVSAAGPLFFMSCDPDELAEHRIGETSVVYAANGAVLATIAADEQSRPVELEQISPWLQKATVAIEDRRFYQHRGIDYRGIARALVRDVEAGGAAEGGSTITQQLARTLYLDSEKTISRKLTEACVAAAIERRWSKERILETYLNRVYYGNRANGADAASRTYFSKPPAELTLVEAALLAGLPQAPSQLDPIDNPEAAKARRAAVLEALAELDEISEEQLEEAREAPIELTPSPIFGEQRDAYLASYVHDLLVEEYGQAAVQRGGFEVHTTIDGPLQRQAREAVLRTLDREDDPAAAVVAVDPENGAIRALVAVVPGRESISFNYAVDGKRQAGSTFKTFALAEAVGRGINPWATAYLSAPFSGPESEGEPWQVKTYDDTYVGRVPLAGATLRSDNTVYARLIVDLEPEQVLETARAMGVRSELPPVPSIVLGSGSVSPLEMTVGYATLASGGVRVEPRLIQRVVRPDGREDGAGRWGDPERERALPAEAAYQVTRVLEQNIASGTGTGAQIGRPAAGKTGTTDEHTDAWFSGYTPQLAATVWIGYPDRQVPMRDVHGIPVTGGSFPATIWQRVMAAAHEELPVVGFQPPGEEIAWRRWCGRVQFARTMADARPDNRCPQPRPAPATTEQQQEEETETRPATTEEEPPEEEAPPPPPPTTTAEPPAPPPAEPGVPPPPNLVGRRGVVTVDIPQADGTGVPALGEVQVGNRSWFAASEDGAPIPRRTEVEVVAVEADHVVVRPRPRGG